MISFSDQLKLTSTYNLHMYLLVVLDKILLFTDILQYTQFTFMICLTQIEPLSPYLSGLKFDLIFFLIKFISKLKNKSSCDVFDFLF